MIKFKRALCLLPAVALLGCGGSGSVAPVVTTITPAQVQSLAADVGYMAYEFTPQATVVQPILAGACALDTTQDPLAIAQELQRLLQGVWSGIDAVNTPEGTVIVLLINNLVSDLGLTQDLTSATATVSPYIVSATVGLCQGIQAAQTGHMPAELKASLRSEGLTPVPMGMPPAMIVPGSYTIDDLGAWAKIKSSKIWFWNW